MKVSVVVCCLDEEELLPACLAAAKAGLAPGDELLVCDGGSADASRAVAERAGARVLTPGRGRALQLDAGARAASGDVLLFLHADTVLPEGWRAALDRGFSPGVAAAGFRLGFAGEGLALISACAELRERLTGVPQGDQALSVRRDEYLSVGGFPPVPLMEEYELVRRLKTRGRVARLPQRVSTSPRRHLARGPLMQGLRNNLIILLYYLGVPPARLAGLYR